MASVRPGGGTLAAYEAPSGPGVRTDGFGYAGYRTVGAFDSLLAKVIAHSPRPDFAAAVARAARALSEFRIDGVATNIAFLRNILAHPDFVAGKVHTRWVDEHVAELARAVESAATICRDRRGRARERRVRRCAGEKPRSAGACSRTMPPVKAEQQTARPAGDEIADMTGPDGSVGVASPIQGTIVAINVAVGDEVRPGQQVAVVEAMKMEHVITAPHSGIVRGVTMAAGDVVREGFPIVFIQEAEVEGGAVAAADELDLDHIRDDLREKHRAPRADPGREPTGGRGAAAQDRHTGCRGKTSSAWSIPARSTNTGRWSSRASISAIRSTRCARTRPATAWSPACARSTATCSTRADRARRWCITTTPCWPARRGIAITTSRTGCSNCASASACRWCCSAKAAAGVPARITSARASRSIRTPSPLIRS